MQKRVFERFSLTLFSPGGQGSARVRTVMSYLHCQYHTPSSIQNWDYTYLRQVLLDLLFELTYLLKNLTSFMDNKNAVFVWLYNVCSSRSRYSSNLLLYLLRILLEQTLYNVCQDLSFRKKLRPCKSCQLFNINEGLGLLKLADTSLILINPSPSNVQRKTVPENS